MSLNCSLLMIAVCGLSFATQSQAAIQAMASRVIYPADEKAATLSIKNNAKLPYMAQIWLEPGVATDASQKIPMIVTPPLLRLEPQKESALRFIYSGQGLPTDRESQYWINIQEIPPKPKEKNILQIAIRSKIKLFYRPESVKMQLPEAVKQLRWFVQDGQLKLENKSPLHITIGEIQFNHTAPISQLQQDMVAPFQTIKVLDAAPANTKNFSYTYINDYGGPVRIDHVALQSQH